MDETGPDGSLSHTVPSHWVFRAFLVGCGTFVLIVVVRELWRGVWPLNVLTPFFGIILGGGGLVGGMMILAGLFGMELRWTVRKGEVEILATNPFWRRTYSFAPADISGFAIREIDDSDGPALWTVQMKAVGGKRFETRQFGSRDMAETVKKRFEAAFYG